MHSLTRPITAVTAAIALTLTACAEPHADRTSAPAPAHEAVLSPRTLRPTSGVSKSVSTRESESACSIPRPARRSAAAGQNGSASHRQSRCSPRLNSSGGAGPIRNDIAIVTPPGRAPTLLTVRTENNNPATPFDNAVVSDIAAAVFGTLEVS
ncbi:hypothetical protein [Rhodococcus sp. IEGM 1366]|uniref:hypothetical protein n=1 Tax=Rhodococcus sp. IEGM 1366 TaxID=3082223 RepID=UPI002954C1DD|nr:hypothetical protein [Rhodococcus sp. IEGM 1366]